MWAPSQLAELVQDVATAGRALDALQVPASQTLPAPQLASVVPHVVFAAQQLHLYPAAGPVPQLAASVHDDAVGNGFEVLHVPATQTFPEPHVLSLLLLVHVVFAAQQSQL